VDRAGALAVAHLWHILRVSEQASISISELQQHASRYVAMAQKGRRIAVTDRGEVVAYLVPADEPTTNFQRMVAAGQLRLAKGNLKETPATREPLEARPGERTPSEVLQEMRDEERY
jgi:prevent-host-death family protein